MPPSFYHVLPKNLLERIFSHGLKADSESSNWDHISHYGIYLWIDLFHAINYLDSHIDVYQNPVILKISPNGINENLIVADEDEFLSPGYTPEEQFEEDEIDFSDPSCKIHADMANNGLLEINSYKEAITWIADYIMRNKIKPKHMWSERYLGDIEPEFIDAVFAIKNRKPTLIWPESANMNDIADTL